MYADFLKTAEEAARVGGEVLMKRFGRPMDVEYKGDVDLVTVADRMSEEAVVSMIHARYPDHQVMAEEGTIKNSASSSKYRWIIDPLDGTTNYAHAFPCFAVAVGLEVSGRMAVGVVYDPVRDECFAAQEGRGAFLNGRPIHVSEIESLDKALLATGFPYDRREHTEKYLRHFKSFLIKAQEVRRPGAATIDLCYLAAGRLDGFWESKLHPWDIAAASVIVREAGGRMSDFKGGEFSIYGEETLASNGKIHEEMLAVLEGA